MVLVLVLLVYFLLLLLLPQKACSDLSRSRCCCASSDSGWEKRAMHWWSKEGPPCPFRRPIMTIHETKQTTSTPSREKEEDNSPASMLVVAWVIYLQWVCVDVCDAPLSSSSENNFQITLLCLCTTETLRRYCSVWCCCVQGLLLVWGLAVTSTSCSWLSPLLCGCACTLWCKVRLLGII